MKITRSSEFYRANCLECDELDANANREQVLAHVKLTGHAAQYLIEDITTYWPAVKPPLHRSL